MTYRSFARIAALLVVLLVTQFVLSPFTLYRDFGLLSACASSRDRDCTEEEAAVEAARRAYDKAVVELEAQRKALRLAEELLVAAENRLNEAMRAYERADARAIGAEVAVNFLEYLVAGATAADLARALQQHPHLLPALVTVYKKVIAKKLCIFAAKEFASYLHQLANDVKTVRDTAQGERNKLKGTRDAAKKARDEAIEARNAARTVLSDAEDALALCHDFK